MTAPRLDGDCLAEREAFEAWFCEDGDYEPEWLITSGANHMLYMDADTENMWQAFQAGAALSASKQGGWMPISTAPKSRDCGDGRIEGAYILGFCPDPDVCNLESAICVVWWEPLMNKGKGMWYGEGGYETRPTHWMPLPPAPAQPQGDKP